MLRVLLLDLDASPTAATPTPSTPTPPTGTSSAQASSTDIPGAGGPPPHLTDALDALPRFRTAAGELLTWAVVTQDARGLDGADRSAYRRALERLGLHVPLEDCVVIAEDRGRLDVCRTLGMTPVQFARTPAASTPQQSTTEPSTPQTSAEPSTTESSTLQPSTPRFTDWLDGLLLVRALVAPRQRETAKVALAPWFSARGAHLVSVGDDVDAHAATVVLRLPSTMQTPSGTVPGHATTTSRVTFDHDGHVVTVTPVDPPASSRSAAGTTTVDDASRDDDAAEAALLRASLRDSGALATSDGPIPPGATHTETIDDTGALVVRRTRYSAI